jgi:hypothetical protein
MATTAILNGSAGYPDLLKVLIAAKSANVDVSVSSTPPESSKSSASLCSVGELRFQDANAAARYLGGYILSLL